MIDDYVARFRPHVTGPDNTYLFPNKAGGHKTQSTLSQQVKETIGKRTGLRASVHQFRHLAAKLELTMGSGLMSETARLLGHKNLKTTVSFYAGLQTNLAARRYQDVIQGERESIARPRDGKRHGSR